eukprot:m.197550 g.197550  ORF g.197550 m.197550 type:complete len:102 (-) comp25095_c0_seq2:1815-2120(-)
MGHTVVVKVADPPAPTECGVSLRAPGQPAWREYYLEIGGANESGGEQGDGCCACVARDDTDESCRPMPTDWHASDTKASGSVGSGSGVRCRRRTFDHAIRI